MSAAFITARDRFPVLALPKLELCFKDGSRLWLRQVNSDPLQRSVEMPDKNAEPLRVDLRELSPTLERDFTLAHSSDRPGLIFFELRQRYSGAEQFLAAVNNQSRAH